MFLVASTPRPRSEPVAAVVAAHWSNIQLTRVELSTPDATTRDWGEKTKHRASTTWFRSQKACGRVGTRKGGREEPGEKHLADKATEDLLRKTTSGRAEEAQARDKFSRSVRQTKTEQTRVPQWKQARKSPLEGVAERVGWQANEKRESWRRRAMNALWVSQHPLGM